MMCTMRLGRRVPTAALALALAFAPTLAGCGLLDLDGGSTLEDAFEYLPADTFSVEFADRGSMAERLGVDDIDPRDVRDSDLDDVLAAFKEERETTLATTELTAWLQAMKDAPLNDFDVEWQAFAAWGDADEDIGDLAATVWKVGDDVDFDALADDLKEKGYDVGSSGDLPMYSIDLSEADTAGLVGGVYPAPLMLNVMLDKDDEIVVVAPTPDPLGDVADVIADDTDSLADDSGGMGDLLDAADGDPELAVLTAGGPGLCDDGGGPLPEQLQDEYGDLGRPDARALFVAGEDPKALLVLQYGSEDDAKADLDAREALIDEGVDIQTRESFDDLGHFSLEQDGDLVLIDEDFDGGPVQALRAERARGGPGVCGQEAD